jgi:hypothetical protein
MMTLCDVQALKKCLEEHKGDGEKCKELIGAFKTACSQSKPPGPPPQDTVASKPASAAPQ